MDKSMLLVPKVNTSNGLKAEIIGGKIRWW